MPLSRYARTPVIDYGRQYGTSTTIEAIRSAIASGAVPVQRITLRGSERLDTLAGGIYGDASYWWVLAAASDIGWGLQVPAGTVITIPDLGSIASIVG